MARPTIQSFPTNLIELYELANELGNDRPLRRILFLARDLGCRSIIRQKGLIHPGFDSEWEDYYQHVYPPTKKTVEKLHFFSKNLQSISDLGNVGSKEYLGYVILRPIPEQRVCEAVLRPPREPHCDYVLAKGKYKVRISGHRFEIEGTPFVQQDGNAGVCAHASLVTISKIAPHVLPTDDPAPWTLTQIKSCVSQIASPITGRGLNLAEVARVFENMGYSGSTVYRFQESSKTRFRPEQIIYMYVESKIPVFVGIELPERGTGHSVVLTGHSFDKHAWWPEALPSYYMTVPSGESWISSVSWAGSWVICDDNFGPYLAMPKHLCDVSWIAVPLPKQILLKAEMATLNAFWSVRMPFFKDLLDKSLSNQSSAWTEVFNKHLKDGKVVMRTFLTTSEDFRSSVRTDRSMHTGLKNYYLGMTLPDRVWISELSIPELFREGLKLGEVLVNPHYPAKYIKQGDEALFAVHAPGAFVHYHAGATATPLMYYVNGDRPYQVLKR